MMRLMSSIGSALDSVTDSTRLRYKINYPQLLWISQAWQSWRITVGLGLRLIGYFLLKVVTLGKSESAIEPISPDLFLYIITLQYESSDAPRKTGMLIRGVSIPLKSAGRAHAYPQAPGL
jgi:hypothetical protein